MIQEKRGEVKGMPLSVKGRRDIKQELWSRYSGAEAALREYYSREANEQIQSHKPLVGKYYFGKFKTLKIDSKIFLPAYVKVVSEYANNSHKVTIICFSEEPFLEYIIPLRRQMGIYDNNIEGKFKITGLLELREILITELLDCFKEVDKGVWDKAYHNYCENIINIDFTKEAPNGN